MTIIFVDGTGGLLLCTKTNFDTRKPITYKPVTSKVRLLQVTPFHVQGDWLPEFQSCNSCSPFRKDFFTSTRVRTAYVPQHCLIIKIIMCNNSTNNYLHSGTHQHGGIYLVDMYNLAANPHQRIRRNFFLKLQ